jgi:hypothetical protein
MFWSRVWLFSFLLGSSGLSGVAHAQVQPDLLTVFSTQEAAYVWIQGEPAKSLYELLATPSNIDVSYSANSVSRKDVSKAIQELMQIEGSTSNSVEDLKFYCERSQALYFCHLEIPTRFSIQWHQYVTNIFEFEGPLGRALNRVVFGPGSRRFWEYTEDLDEGYLEIYTFEDRFYIEVAPYTI